MKKFNRFLLKALALAMAGMSFPFMCWCVCQIKLGNMSRGLALVCGAIYLIIFAWLGTKIGGDKE